MHFIVVGCGRVGSDLAYRLWQKDHQVVVIDTVPEAFQHLPPDFRGLMLEGQGLSYDVLHRAGIEKADGLAAVTDSDPVNAVIGHIARTLYRIPHVVIRNNDPGWRVFHELFNLQIVSAASWGAQRLEELLYPTATPIVFSAGNGEVEIYECEVPASFNGRPLRDMLPDSGCIAASLTRAGCAELPSADTVLEKGDILHLSATLEGIEALRARIEAQRTRSEALHTRGGAAEEAK
jgi:trk system potassium uptake protein TrkA